MNKVEDFITSQTAGIIRQVFQKSPPVNYIIRSFVDRANSADKINESIVSIGIQVNSINPSEDNIIPEMIFYFDRTNDRRNRIPSITTKIDF